MSKLGDHGRNLAAGALGLVLAALVGWIGLKVIERKLKPAPPPNERNQAETETLARVLPGWSAPDLQRLLDECWLRPLASEPFTEFREAPFRGRFVNVDEAGFRWSVPQCEWPPPAPSYSVFLFGGSTTFGYGVADGDTVASALQEQLRAWRPDAGVCVYNFGRGWYYSSQERLLLERLLVAGVVPKLAVFLDGFNDFQYAYDESRYAQVFERVVRESGAHYARAWRERGWSDVGASPAPRGAPPAPASTPRPPATPREVLTRYWRNARLAKAAGAAFGFETAFVWQAVPAYGYDLSRHPYPERLNGQDALREGYRLMADERERPPITPFLWCADIQEGAPETLYVDAVHYSPALSRRMAACIVNGLRGGSSGLGR